MRIAVFSDVHGNLSALDAVIGHMEQQPGLDQIIFAGDLCLFGPRPAACIQRLRKRRFTCIIGNTDDWIIDPPSVTPDLEYNERQRRLKLQEICHWTREQLDESMMVWLRELQKSFSIRISPSDDRDNDLLIVHANPRDLGQLIFPPIAQQQSMYGKIRQTDADLESILGDFDANMLAFGHLHVPFLRNFKHKLLLNVSSVSMPGDGDGRAKYALLNWQEKGSWQTEHHFVEFQIQPEIEAFEQNRPPYWEDRVATLNKFGYIPQVV